MKTIKAKLSAILLLSLGIVLAIVIWGISSLWGQVHQYQGLIVHEAKDQQRVLEIATDFKVQVQEWKNVLLRGSDNKKREKYWTRFQERETKIQTNINKLHADLIEGDKHNIRHQQSPAAELVGSFAQAHLAMGTAYRTGFDAFVAANFDAAVGDKAVSGIDREPAKLLAAAAKELNTLMQTAAKNALEHSQSVIITTIILVVIGIILAITLFLVMASRMIIRPVHTLTESISHLAASDYSKEITYTNSDEIGNLADNARLMQQNMKDVLSTLMQSADKAAHAANHLSTSSTEARKTATDQQFQTEQVATAMNEMSTTVHEVAQSAQTAASSAKEADRLTKEGHKVVTSTIDAINNLALEVERTSTVVESLAEDSQSIGGILDVIRSIAEQTNLLALNAAIEAARAGDQGRGFAVVADEVRSLAQRTQESTAEIQKMIEKLQSGASDAVAVLISGKEQAKVCVDIAALTDTALDEIEQSIAAINDMNVHIASASEEQSTVAEEINQNVIAINHSTEVTVGNVSDIENASGEVASLSQQFNGITQRFTV